VAELATIGLQLELDLTVVGLSIGDLHRRIERVGPGLVPLPSGDYLALLSGRKDAVVALAPDGRRIRVCRVQLTELLVASFRERARATIGPSVGAAMAAAGLEPEGLLRPLLDDASLDGVILVRPGAAGLESGLITDVVRAGVLLVCAQLGRTMLLVLSWALLGSMILDGRAGAALLSAWGGLLALVVGLAVGSRWVQATLSHRVGVTVHRLLLHRTLRAGAEEQSPTAGTTLGRVLEADSLDGVAIEGGLLASLAGLDLLVAAWVLSQGAAAPAQLLSLGIWTGLTLAGAVGQARARRTWVRHRVERTARLVERLRGHRIDRMLGLGRVHLRVEDAGLREELEVQARVDRMDRRFGVVPSRAVLLTGVLLLLPQLHSSAPELAIAIGGLLLASDALDAVAHGAAGLGDAVGALYALKPMLRSPSKVPAPPDDHVEPLRPGMPLVGRGLTVHRGTTPVLRDRSVHLRAGEKAVLCGAAGSGKSTLAHALAGLLPAESGAVQCGGYDPVTLGPAGWARVVALAPQLDDNHIFSGSLAFNLLLGRRWPPRPDDLEAARATCEALGLGPLLEAMPGGLEEQVGESGWHLSHGERSRVFLARALLQDAKVVIADEVLDALDPQTAARVVEVLEQAKASVLLISRDGESRSPKSGIGTGPLVP
jgi:ATP-binding cassette subfamily B protein